jgi:hypothetical protein
MFISVVGRVEPRRKIAPKVMSRRSVILGLSSSPVALCLPSAARANPFGLAIGRFFAGLIFNVSYAVFVKMASNYIVSELIRGRSVSSFSSLPTVSNTSRSAQSFEYYAPDNYQASLGIGNLTELNISRDMRIQSFINEADETTLARLESLQRYLFDKKVNAAFYGPTTEASRMVRMNEPLHNILAIKYLAGSDAEVQNHYRSLLDEIGADVFEGVRL